MQTENDLDATGVRRALVLDEQNNLKEGAEGVYRAVAPLRDQLPADAQKHLAAVFEWAREGIHRQIESNRTPELEALHAAYTYARDVLIAAVQKASGGS